MLDQPRPGGSRNLSYILPKDVLEGNRLDLQHRVFQYALEGNFAVPLDQGVANILDVGCGTGIWGEEVALDFPGARVVNVDIDPAVQSNRASGRTIPLNYHFVQCSILQGLPFPDDLFDFTHQRMLVAAIPTPAWPAVLRDLVRVTRPGGRVELLEIGQTYDNAGPATTKLLGWVHEVLTRKGVPHKVMEQLGSMAEEAGLRVKQVRHLDLPVGSWDPYIGVLMERNLQRLIESLEPMVRQQLNVASADYASALNAAPGEWAERRMTLRFYLVQGQA